MTTAKGVSVFIDWMDNYQVEKVDNGDHTCNGLALTFDQLKQFAERVAREACWQFGLHEGSDDSDLVVGNFLASDEFKKLIEELK